MTRQLVDALIQNWRSEQFAYHHHSKIITRMYRSDEKFGLLSPNLFRDFEPQKIFVINATIKKTLFDPELQAR
jgi:hypothetical protein